VDGRFPQYSGHVLILHTVHSLEHSGSDEKIFRFDFPKRIDLYSLRFDSSQNLLK